MKPTTTLSTKPYPRGLPYQGPEEMQAEAARLGRWTLFLVFATAFLLLGGICAFVFLKYPSRSAAPEAVAIEEPKSALEKSPGSLSAPKLSLGYLPTQKKKPALSMPAIQIDAKHRERFLETVGGLSAAHLYQSYLNIGLVADAVESESYTKTDAANLLQTIGELVILVDNHLSRLNQVGLEPEDQQAIDRTRALAALLRVQTNSLLGYWATGDMDHVERYHVARDRTWGTLKEMLGIQE